jgi:hypothetical protein
MQEEKMRKDGDHNIENSRKGISSPLAAWEPRGRAGKQPTPANILVPRLPLSGCHG